MNIFQLWWTATVRPRRAFAAIRRKPAPWWAFRVLLFFNLMISVASTLPRLLLGYVPLLPSWLTFLPNDRYLEAELFFLPILRMATWLLAGGVIHLGIRLSGKRSDMDRILNIAGIQYLVVLPYTFLVDWTTMALGIYEFELIAIIHGMVDLVWSVALGVIGLKVLLKLSTGMALILTLLGAAFTIPLLAVFAR